MLSNNSTYHRLSLPAAALIVLVVASSIYGTASNPYAPTASTGSTIPTLTNPEVLENWLPTTSYQDTLSHIDSYISQHKLSATTLTIVSNINTDNFTYDFTVKLLPGNQSLPISVTVTNYSPILSDTVSINGTMQSPGE